MPSPFPGMDPFLESPALWSDFHHELASGLRRRLNETLPSRYFARIEQREVTDRATPEELGVVIPDASVVDLGGPPPRPPAQGSPAATVASAVEVVLELPVPAKQYSIHVFRLADERLVTAIEIVSPANKRAGSTDQRRYLRKRSAYLESDAHFLEIDLLRGGARWPAGHEPQAAYRVLLSRASRRPRAAVWPIALRDRLPAIVVPLADGDPDLPLDLQAVFERLYDEVGYGRYVRYREPVPPPTLSDDEVAWVRGRLG